MMTERLIHQSLLQIHLGIWNYDPIRQARSIKHTHQKLKPICESLEILLGAMREEVEVYRGSHPRIARPQRHGTRWIRRLHLDDRGAPAGGHEGAVGKAREEAHVGPAGGAQEEEVGVVVPANAAAGCEEE